jgi:glutathione synthase/RimK-type ligase-like ATP-grasp enzyme
VDWAALAVVMVRSTWDYWHRRSAFVAWARRVEASTALWNPAATIAWNTDKAYLRDLAAAGVPTVPTRWCDAGTAVDLPALLADAGWDEAVVKPAVSAGSWGTVRVRRDEAAGAQAHLDGLLARGDALVQPYLPAIEAEGETSVVMVDGALTHAVRKVPARGDFRVQESFGAAHVAVPLGPELRALAEAALAWGAAGCRYGRVDVVAGPDGGPVVIELELTEPQLFLRHDRAAAERLADALAAARDADPRSDRGAA